MRYVALWSRVTPSLILLVAGVIGAIQVLLFQVVNTSLTIQAIVEGLVLFVVVVGLFLIPSTRRLTELPSMEAESVYPPILLGLGLITVRAVTDLLDEFLDHPDIALTFLEDVSMVLGLGLLVLGISRWARTRKIQEIALLEQRERLENQNERLDSFVSVVSHDLRNPLNVAQGHLELARDEHDTDDLREVARSLDRMALLIDDLLSLARHGTDIGDDEPIALSTFVDECWRNVETTDANLVVATDRVVVADRSRLRQLLENLFRNAVEHAGPNVTVTVGELDDGFYVEDDGDGLPREDRDQVFEAGFSTDSEGTGFGLSIVEEIAAAHGWSIDVTDGGNGGARFEFTGVDFE